MSRTLKFANVVILLCMLVFVSASPAHAFDGRSGDKVIVSATEVVDDDLYVGANQFVLDGTVNGDVIAAGQTITINGQVSGNLIAAAQTVIINGSVGGDVVAAGAVLFFGEKAEVGGDVVGAGYSLELRNGSKTGRDIVLGAAQALLAGDVGRNVLAGTGALAIAGRVGGNVKAAVDEAGQTPAGPPPTMFMQQSAVPTPLLKHGLTIDPGARIQGDLQYTQNTDLILPAGVVAGKITRQAQPVEARRPTPQETAGAKVVGWGLGLIRSLITLTLIGLFLLWLFPAFVGAMTEALRSQPLPSLGWGVVAYAGFFFLVLLITFGMILGAVVFGLLTLGGLSGSIIGIGILALLTLILGFVLATSFLTKIVFGAALGKWMLSRLSSPLAEHRYWPMVIGLAVTVVVIALLSFPLIPGFLGGLLNFAVILIGLGALWLWGRGTLERRAGATT